MALVNVTVRLRLGGGLGRVGGGGGEGPFSRISMYGVSPPPFYILTGRKPPAAATISKALPTDRQTNPHIALCK